MYTAQLHGASISDYAPIELHCTGTDHVHYATQRDCGQLYAFPVARTDGGTGQSWYRSGNGFYFGTAEGAAQYMADRDAGVVRIARDGIIARYQGSRRLADAIA